MNKIWISHIIAANKQKKFKKSNSQKSRSLKLFPALFTIISLTYACRLWELCGMFVGTIFRQSLKNQSIHMEIFPLLVNVVTWIEALSKKVMYCSRWNTEFTPSTNQGLRRLLFFYRAQSRLTTAVIINSCTVYAVDYGAVLYYHRKEKKFSLFF